MGCNLTSLIASLRRILLNLGEPITLEGDSWSRFPKSHFFATLLLSLLLPLASSDLPAEAPFVFKGKTVEQWIVSSSGDGKDFYRLVEAMGSAAIPDLAAVVESDRPNAERVRAIDALGVLLRYDGTRRLKGVATERALPALRRALKDESGWVRAKSMNTLRHMGPWAEDAAPDLIAIVKNKEDPDQARFSTRTFAVLALGAIGEREQTVPVLIDALEEPDPKLRRIAVSALREMSYRARAAVPKIEAAIAVNDEEFRQAAEEALEEIRRPAPPLVGDPVPDLELAALAKEERIRLAEEYRGRVVALDFWSITCPPCQPAMAKLEALAAKRADWRGQVAFVGISVQDEPAAAAKHALKAGWKSVELLSDADGKVHRHFRASLPELVLVDAAGKIIWRGHPTEIALEKEIETLLANP